MKDFMTIDGSMGEGGGQVLRTALSLSAITGMEIELRNIRADRAKLELKRQHMTSVKAVTEICCAKVSEVDASSRELESKPDSIKDGDYRFDIGTAGSVTLVAQTVMPVLMKAFNACEKHLADLVLLPLNMLVGGVRRLEQVVEYWDDLVLHPSWDLEVQKETLHNKVNHEVIAEVELHK